jgi:uncharacterized protein YwqG
VNVSALGVALAAAGVSGYERLLTLALPAVELVPGDDADPTSRRSRIGGLPLLPSGTPWPEWKGTPLSFVAHVCFDQECFDGGRSPSPGSGEVSAVLREQGFPRSGLLSVFYDADQSTWGFDPKDRDSFRLVYCPDSAAAIPADDFPDHLPEEARFLPVDVECRRVVTMPNPWSETVAPLALSEEETLAYSEALADWREGQAFAERTLVGGHPDSLQGDMAIGMEITGNQGVYAGDGAAHQDPRFPEWAKASAAWRHIIQIHSVDEAQMMWGDMGCLYFWLRDKDLKAQAFERAWFALQCG